MIKVKHPLDTCNQAQENLIATCQEKDRRFHELMFTYGNATYRYHERVNEHPPTMEDFKEWLEGLPDNIRKDMNKKGFEYCKTSFPFTRYVNEKNDLGMDEFVKNLMGEEFEEYKKFIVE